MLADCLVVWKEFLQAAGMVVDWVVLKVASKDIVSVELMDVAMVGE